MVGVFSFVLLSILGSLSFVALADLPPVDYPYLLAPLGAYQWPAPLGYDNQNIDAVFQRATDQTIWTFQGTKVWVSQDPNWVASGAIPALDAVAYDISTVFPGLTGPVDAAFFRPTGKVLIFVGDVYYRYSDLVLAGLQSNPGGGFTLDPLYPRLISKGFIGLPSNLDAIMELPNRHIYAFVGSVYYRIYDRYLNPAAQITDPDRVEKCYPKQIEHRWPGVTLPIRAVFNSYSDKLIHFFAADGTVTPFLDKYQQTRFADRVLLSPPSAWPAIVAPSTCVFGNPAPPTFPTSGITSVFQRKTGHVYYFTTVGEYWRVTDELHCSACYEQDCLDEGYPKKITDNWIGFPTGATVDAVLERANGLIYLFTNTPTGVVYYRYPDKYQFTVIIPNTGGLGETYPATDTLDPDQPTGDLTDFGINLSDIPAGATIIGAFQRPNGKMYLFFRTDPNTVIYFRISDGFLVDGIAADVVDPGYNAVQMDQDYFGVPMDTLTTMYQRTWSNQQIYWIITSTPGGAHQYATCFDQFITPPYSCTPCEPQIPVQDD